MSLGGPREEESPPLGEEVLGREVGQLEVAVGEDDEAGGVEGVPVRGEGAGGDVRAVGSSDGISWSQVRTGPPLTPTVTRGLLTDTLGDFPQAVRMLQVELVRNICSVSECVSDIYPPQMELSWQEYSQCSVFSVPKD